MRRIDPDTLEHTLAIGLRLVKDPVRRDYHKGDRDGAANELAAIIMQRLRHYEIYAPDLERAHSTHGHGKKDG